MPRSRRETRNVSSTRSAEMPPKMASSAMAPVTTAFMMPAAAVCFPVGRRQEIDTPGMETRVGD